VSSGSVRASACAKRKKRSRKRGAGKKKETLYQEKKKKRGTLPAPAEEGKIEGENGEKKGKGGTRSWEKRRREGGLLLFRKREGGGKTTEKEQRAGGELIVSSLVRKRREKKVVFSLHHPGRGMGRGDTRKERRENTGRQDCIEKRGKKKREEKIRCISRNKKKKGKIAI